ncbi:cell division protein [Sphingomonas naphthae]|uniref:Cell division protein n=1 Tax=Sphingomonas naphthae TaxID=1813468 RepID=A0ABY7TKT6_9SPHN|nr:cell division protein [Sphingomonas naphthae]WCT73848.1 cell division protein [Sphingomonas naphthae]
MSEAGPTPLPGADSAPAARPARIAAARPLPEGRFTGPMPWLVAIMLFLIVLASALGIGLSRAASGMGEAIEGRLTIQVMQPDPIRREAETNRALAELRRLAGITRVERIDDAALAKLLEPWLGGASSVGDLPLPALIDVDLAAGDGARADIVARAVQRVAPSARVDDHAAALAPIAGLIGSLSWLAVAIVVLTTAATAFVVILATRSALDTHAATIDVLHLLGATDMQVARLFQRRISYDALWGAVAGAVPAMAIILLLGGRVSRLGSELAGSASLGLGWIVLLLLPPLAALLAREVTRFTVLRVLSRVP